MIVDIKVPDLGESINVVEIGEWLVTVGAAVTQDQPLVAIESEKATIELPAPGGGVLVEILKGQGQAAAIGEIIGRIDSAGQAVAAAAPPDEKVQGVPVVQAEKVMPSAARILAQNRIAAGTVTPTGPGGRILKEDALLAVAKGETAFPPAAAVRPKPAVPADEGKGGRRVAMSLLRRTIAERLIAATQSMAMLTTFNEADMTEVKTLRAVLGPAFVEKHGVRLGFMSFFVKAAVAALKDFPLVNARIDGDDIVYQDSCDIGMAVGGGKGLVVPVLRRAEDLGFAAIEQAIADFGLRAKNNTLSLEELRGGTFTITNGGVYGSMLSTPIVNPPQSAILGLHAIKDRPVAISGEVQVRPVMYLALTYDHRLIDGREAVGFLKSIKERIEQPCKLLLEI